MKVRMRKGTREQAHTRGVNIPPAYTHIRVAVEADAYLQATARTGQGKTAYFYHPDYIASQQAKKWERIAAFRGRVDRVVKVIEGEARTGVPEALTLSLILQTGMRNGGEKQQGLKKTFGASSLLMEHVVIPEGSASLILTFPGKHSVLQHLVVDDPVLVEYVHQRRLAGEERVFPHTSRETLGYLRTLDHTLKVHDLRAWLATALALAFRDALADQEIEPKKLKKIISEAVAAKLGNTAAAVRKAYMDPSLL